MNEEYKSYILKRIHFLFTAWIGFLVVGLFLCHYFPHLVDIINYLYSRIRIDLLAWY